MYIDIGETLTVTNLNRPNEKCLIKFERRGWFSNEAFKLEGSVFVQEGKKKDKKFDITGNWNSRIFFNRVNETPEEVWTKTAPPELWDHMYGMSRFSLQMNYFPKRLENVVAPTDTRRRPDQRALENGDMKLAAVEKERLEVRQRAFRKLHESSGTHHAPRYFVPWQNPSDN